MARKRHQLDPEERRENALRPSSYLGYNRDDLGMYLMSREAFTIAESQFRRAIWLNPYEPLFKEHLAWCLLQQHRYGEAAPLIDEAIALQSDDPRRRELKRLIENGINADIGEESRTTVPHDADQRKDSHRGRP
jgi:tetratricopeptide (TPR) repeat protein